MAFTVTQQSAFAATLQQGNVTIELVYSSPMWVATYLVDGVQLLPWEGGRFPYPIANRASCGRMIKGNPPIAAAIAKFG